MYARVSTVEVRPSRMDEVVASPTTPYCQPPNSSKVSRAGFG